MSLTDPRFTVPVPEGTSPFRVAQRRMARWLDGPAHLDARRHAVDALAGVDAASLGRRASEISQLLHVVVLAEALGFTDPLACGLRQPAISAALLDLTGAVPPAAAAALESQLAASGRTDPDEAANVVALLHQCFGATAALIAGVDPPVASSVRIAPDGSRLSVPLDDTPFGAGPHACPGRDHALALAAALATPRNP